METPKEYTKNLKNNILTTEMLIDCLFSVNKRAKNCRDKEREYRDKFRGCRYGDKYGTEEKYREKKEEYYSQKEKILTLFTPDCIHSEVQQRRTRIYDYEEEYGTTYLENEVIHSGHYFDPITDEPVFFDDIMLPHTQFYLFYDFGKCSFHTPIDEYLIKNYPNLEIINIGSLTTYGKDIDVLLSTQFVKKVLALIENNNYVYVDNKAQLAC